MPAELLEETDNGPRKTGQERYCVVTRRVRPVHDMIRFVAGPDGIVPDLKRKLPGRGVWVTARRAAVTGAVKSGAFKRSLKADVRVAADLADLTERLLVRAALDALAIAHKAGLVASGFGKVEAAIARETVVALIHAVEAGADGVRKLDAALARRPSDDGETIAIVRSFGTEQLDLALGRSNVVHAALLAGRASETFLARWHELEHFRLSEPDVRIKAGEDTGAPELAAPELGSE